MAQTAPTQKTRRRGMDNISRVDSGSTRGWTVRFQREGRKYARFFYDARYDGSAEKALKAARRWRNKTRREVGPAGTPDASRMLTDEAREKNRRSVSQTGVTGIGLQVREFATQRVPYVTAYWIDGDGRRRMTSFSIGRHGVENAVSLAARARAQTAEWHGAEPMTAEEIRDAAVDPIQELAAPYLDEEE